MELAAEFTSPFVGFTHARFIYNSFLNSRLESKISEANTHMFIFSIYSFHYTSQRAGPVTMNIDSYGFSISGTWMVCF